jgi:hypothetical protein
LDGPTALLWHEANRTQGGTGIAVEPANVIKNLFGLRIIFVPGFQDKGHAVSMGNAADTYVGKYPFDD